MAICVREPEKGGAGSPARLRPGPGTWLHSPAVPSSLSLAAPLPRLGETTDQPRHGRCCGSRTLRAGFPWKQELDSLSRDQGAVADVSPGDLA